MIKKITCLSLLVFLNGCQKKTIKKQEFAISQKLEAQVLQESVARLKNIPDVPLPIVIKKIEYAQQNADQLQIWCDFAGMTKAEVCGYYEIEMERLGWQLQASYDSGDGITEEVLIFVKPNGSLCVISLRLNKQMIITILQKKI